MTKKKTTSAPSTKAPKTQTKTAFVLGFPHGMPASKVVEEGKKAGVALTEKAVWSVRSEARTRKAKKGKKPAAPKAAAPKAAAPKAAAPKAAAPKKASKSKAKPKSKAKAQSKAKPKVTHTKTKSHHAVGNHKADDLLRAVAAELGLARAITILQAEHDRVHRILGG